MGENYITCHEQLGSINISEEVIYSMVRAAITEVDGGDNANLDDGQQDKTYQFTFFDRVIMPA
mgnify:CR=1 FL=1